MITKAAQERFDRLYSNLVVGTVQRRFRANGAASTLSVDDVGFLLSAASRYALDAQDTSVLGADMRLRAYEIATLLLDRGVEEDVGVRQATQLILTRLGNFPARDLLRGPSPQGESALPAYLAFEAAVRELENTIHIREDVPITLTDFQVRLLDTLKRSSAVSVSAPTSAGKSFALSLDIVRRFEAGKPLTVVYLVPTRALIRQVMYETIKKVAPIFRTILGPQ